MKAGNKVLFTIVISVLVITHILWDYFSGGVPVHYVLANDDLPGISNWWGLFTVPVLSWITLSLIFKNPEFKSGAKSSKVVIGFLASLLFGIILSLLWEFDLDFIMQYLILTPIILSLFIKVYKPECLLGFVLGMIYTFGGVLPIAFGLILLILSFITHLVLHKGIRYLLSKAK